MLKTSQKIELVILGFFIEFLLHLLAIWFYYKFIA